jgi:hypothetical protein
MKKEIPTVIFIVIGFLWAACRENAANPVGQDKQSFSCSASKCLIHGLSGGNGLDSVFTYLFDQSLIMDFSASSNCCPDSDRFVLSYAIRIDTIVIPVLDTADHLCDCVCPYMLHAELTNLPLDRYIVCCRLGFGQCYGDPIHSVAVHRNK